LPSGATDENYTFNIIKIDDLDDDLLINISKVGSMFGLLPLGIIFMKPVTVTVPLEVTQDILPLLLNNSKD